MARPLLRLFDFVRRRPWSVLSLAVVLAAAVVGGLNLWAWHHFHAAEQALRDEQLDAAEEHISCCLRIWPRSSATHLLAARIDRLTGHYLEAEQHLAECVRLQHGASEASQLEEILLRAETGEVAEVEAGLWKCIEADHPQSTQILETLARVYLREARYEAALACLNRWLKREPQSARAWHWRGVVHERLGRSSEAIDDYRRAIEFQPDRWGARLRLANLYLEDKDPTQAFPHLEQLARTHPESRDVAVSLARCQMLRGETDKALVLLDGVLAAHAEDFDALMLRGQLECRQGRYDEGEVWLRRARKLQPHNPELLYSLYDCLRLQPGREREAENTLAQFETAKADLSRLRILLTKVEQSPHDADTICEIGMLFLHLGNEKQGLQWLHRALDENPKHQKAHEALKSHFEQHGDTQKASGHRKRLARLPGSVSETSSEDAARR